MTKEPKLSLDCALELVTELEPKALIEWIQAKRQEELLSFSTAVYILTAQIPSGRVLGYGMIAGLIGSPRAARQVGYALRNLKAEQVDIESPKCIPWWRVIRSSGEIALNSGGHLPDQQALLLQDEGIQVLNYKVSMKDYAWHIV